MKLTPREKRLEKALAVAVAALSFYADPYTYFAIGFRADRPCGSFETDFSITEIDKKPGKRARKAIDRLQKIML